MLRLPFSLCEMHQRAGTDCTIHRLAVLDGSKVFSTLPVGDHVVIGICTFCSPLSVMFVEVDPTL